MEETEEFIEFAKSEKVKAAISAVVVLIVNLGVYLFGVTLDADVLVDVGMAVALLVSTVYALWKNHNFTVAAAKGQAVVNELKGENNVA